MASPQRVGPTGVITTAHQQAQLRIVITDDGPGLVGQPGDDRSGVGLANTRARLSQLYGGDQHLTLERGASGNGACVTIVLPWHTTSRVERT